MKQEQKEPFELFKVLDQNEFSPYSFMDMLKKSEMSLSKKHYFFGNEMTREYEVFSNAERAIQFYTFKKPTSRSEFIQLYINKQKA
jgi:hypothetical protein